MASRSRSRDKRPRIQCVWCKGRYPAGLEVFSFYLPGKVHRMLCMPETGRDCVSQWRAKYKAYKAEKMQGLQGKVQSKKQLPEGLQPSVRNGVHKTGEAACR